MNRRKALKRKTEKVRDFQRRGRQNSSFGRPAAPKPRKSGSLDERAILKNNPPRKQGGRRRDKLPGARGWTQRVFKLYGRHCLACARRRARKGLRPKRAVQAHHVVPVNVILDDTSKSLEVRERIAHDARQGCPVCLDCHNGHEDSVEGMAIFRTRLPQGAIDWAIEHGYEWYLEKHYPC